MKKLSIVIPVYNESKTITEVLGKVKNAPLPHGWTKEMIIVDDGSTDGTRNILKGVGPEFKVIMSHRNGGKGAALKEGFQAATGDFILIQDADLEYDPSDYVKLLEPIIKGKSEVVFGSRTLGRNKVPLSRIFFYGGLLISKIFNFLFRSSISDVATCYKIFPRKYVPELLIQPSNDFVFDVVELSYVLLKKAKIIEVPISYDSRGSIEGKKMSWRHGFRCFRRILSIRIADWIRSVWNFSKRIYSAISAFVSKRRYFSAFLAFAFFFLVFFLVYFSVSTLSSGDDHFFHFRFAQEMLHNGFFSSFQNFKSIYFSRMAHGNDYFMYYNFIFFLVAIPFTFIDPLYLGIKLYAVFAAAGAFTLLYWCLKRFYVRNPFIWTLVILAITSTSSIWRFFLSRPYALAPSLLLLLLYFLYKKNHLGVFILSCAYLFWHSSTFFLPVCVAIAYLVIERFYRTKGDWKNLAYAIGGTAFAILLTYLVSSGFLLFIKDTIFNIYWETILGNKVSIGEGGELYPIDFFNFIQGNALIFATFVTALSVDIFSYIGFRFKGNSESEYFSDTPKERRYLQTTVLVLTACFFLGTIAVSGRFGDYFTFFAALYIALSFDYARRLIKISGSAMIRRSIATGLAIVLVYLFASNMLFLEQKLAYGQSAMQMFQVGNWLKNNSKPGDIVFESNWSWFPQLYYWSPKNYYSEGLEPRFTYNYSQRLYWLSVHMPSNGTVCDMQSCPDMDEALRLALKKATSTEQYAKTEGDKMAAILQNDFRASFIVTSKDTPVFNYILSNNKHFKQEIYDPAFGFSVFRLITK